MRTDRMAVLATSLFFLLNIKVSQPPFLTEFVLVKGNIKFV